ncbi:MAG: tetratricopeptide repeat protein, partial [Cyanobacteria bacterium P01_A01_bin.17]
MAVLPDRLRLIGRRALIAVGCLGAIVGLGFGLRSFDASEQIPLPKDEAEIARVYEKRLEQNPQDQEALRQLVQLYWQQDQHKTAISYLEQLITLQPNNMSLYFQKAGLHALAGQREQEEAAYDVIIARRKNHVMALTNKAILRSMKGDIKTASKLFDQAEAAADREIKKTIRGIATDWLRTQLRTNKPWQKRIAYQPSNQVSVISDVVYTQSKTRSLKLDLYLPRNKPSYAIPGIIVIRGGAWRKGDKEGFAFIASHLAKNGFAAASIEYRTSEEVPFPAA